MNTVTPTDPAFEPPKLARGPEEAGHLKYVQLLLQNPVGAISARAYREPVVVAQSYRRTYATVCDPALLDEILVRRAAEFPKTSAELRVLGSAFGDGVLTARDDTWAKKRRLAAPSFTPAAIRQMTPMMAAPFRRLARQWTAGAQPDVTAAMRDATLEVVARLLFNDPSQIDMEAIAQGVDDYLAPVGWISSYIFAGLPGWMPYPGAGRRARARDRMRAEVSRLVQRRRAAPPEDGDMLGRMLAARDPQTGEGFDDEDMVDMVLTLVATGHETSAHTLTFALYCLAAMPHLQDRLAAEVATAAGTGPIDAVPITALPQVEAFVKETLRLFPVVPMLARQTTRTEVMGGHELAPRSSVLIPIYTLHRHEALWDNPDRFDIDRFLDGTTHGRTKFMPFGAGPRVCVGGTFAMTEMVLGLAEILARVRVSACADTSLDPIHRVTLRPQRDLRLRMSPRARA